MDRDFVFQMIKTISSSFKNTDPDFAAELDHLIENPDVDLNYLKTRLADITKSYDIPESVNETINSLSNGINVLIQKEEDHKLVEENAEKQAQIQEQVEINQQIETQKIEEAKAAEQAKLEEEKIEELKEKPEEEIKEELVEDTVNTNVEEVNTVESTTIEMGPNDTVEGMAEYLMALAEQGIVATAIINGMEVNNQTFNSIEQFKEGYYDYQLNNILRQYSDKSLTRAPGEHTDMAIYTPQGEDNKRVVVLGNVDNGGLDERNSITLEFTDGKDFDNYIMKDLLKAFVVDGQDIKNVEDVREVRRGAAVTNGDAIEQDRNRYFATMTNGNRLALNMAADSIEQAKMYIHSVRIDEYKQEDVDTIKQAEENGMEREQAVQKVLKMQMPSSNGFVSGLGIGAMVGVSIVGNLLVLYLLKIIG